MPLISHFLELHRLSIHFYAKTHQLSIAFWFSNPTLDALETGPIQFTGGSFAHWQVARPSEYRMELSLSIRTRQRAGSLVTVRWSSLRAFQIRLANKGNIVVSPIDLSRGVPLNDWLISSTAASLFDGQWHRLRFSISASVPLTSCPDLGK
ncbi:unnamed protein product [Dibothriocephalus latus]|uniref:Laminin G domain-containing protein n=1 Tax=Dibothriocephalus latus TaxID=60516 RepID=A0A3P7NRA8_DIBLA|nr:unnamed protein product [Dibothriocephalus latus]